MASAEPVAAAWLKLAAASRCEDSNESGMSVREGEKDREERVKRKRDRPFTRISIYVYLLSDVRRERGKK